MAMGSRFWLNAILFFAVTFLSRLFLQSMLTMLRCRLANLLGIPLKIRRFHCKSRETACIIPPNFIRMWASFRIFANS